MPRIDLAALLVATGAHAPFVGFIPREVMERAKAATRRGFPRYQPPTFARLFAAARFRFPGLFAQLRLLLLVETLVCGVPLDDVFAVSGGSYRRPLKPIMFCTTDSDSSAI
jgi:hypothetical protein